MGMLGAKYSRETILDAMTRCRDSKIYNAQHVTEIAESLRKLKKEAVKNDGIESLGLNQIHNMDAVPEKQILKL